MKELNELYKLHHKQIFNYLYRLSGDRELAEDLLQETFYQAYVSIEEFRGDSKVSTWLIQIAKFKYYKEQRKDVNNYKLLEGLKAVFKVGESPEKISIKKEEKDTITKAINNLPELQRDVVILRTYNDMSFKDIGEVIGETETWAKVNYYRSKQKLMKSLKEEGWDYEE